MPPVLKNFDQQLFLNEYWQKNRCLLKADYPIGITPLLLMS